MDSIDEKRVYGERTGKRDAYVATGTGVARVEVSDERVGGFELACRCDAADVAVVDGRPLVATDEDVLLGPDFESTGFGPAVAVGAEGGPVAAGPEGRVARLDDGEWRDLGTVPEVRALDGDLVAAADGVHRLDGTHVGLDDARDVAVAAPGPLVATGDGLYRLGNGWMDELDGACAVVAAADDGRAHAATDDGGLYARDAPGAWTECSLPVSEPIAGVAHGDGDAVYAATADGTFLASGDGREDWRTQTLGLPGVTGIALTSSHP